MKTTKSNASGVTAAGLANYFAGRAVEVPGVHVPRFADRVRRLAPTEVPADDATVVDCFRKLMINAVAKSLPERGAVGISLSAGLDSSLIAAIAARILRRQGRTLYAYTHGFDEFPSIDERPMLRDFISENGIQWRPFAADDLMPFTHPSHRYVDTRTPLANPWREIITGGYMRARADGVQVFMTGNFGDHLYPSPRYWFVDELQRGRIREVCGEMLRRARINPCIWKDPSWRYLVKKVLRLPSRSGTPSWLTERSASLLGGDNEPLPDGFLGHPHPEHVRLAIGRYADHDHAFQQPFEDLFGFKVVHPWRDPELVAFMLALPARFHFRHGIRKWVAREAAKGILPEGLRTRKKESDMTPILNTALREGGRSHKVVSKLLWDPKALWPTFVREDYVRHAFTGGTEEPISVLWRCAWIEYWLACGGNLNRSTL